MSYVRNLRILRAFRIIRIFGRLQSLRMLINALVSSLFPVLNAMLIVLFTIAIYSILGVSIFGHSHPQYFRTFVQGMYTMFQCATFDDWYASHAPNCAQSSA